MNEDEYINSITLEYLLNPVLYNKISEKKNNSDDLIYKDIKFYKKRICQTTKDMCKGEFENNNMKILFINYANTLVHYFKQLDTKDIFQKDYDTLNVENLTQDISADFGFSDIPVTDFSNVNQLFANIPKKSNNLDNFVKKLNVNLEEKILPKKREANIKDPALKIKGVRKKISS